jgi:RHS repeat-associated protein
MGGPADIIHGYVSGGFAGITETYTYNNRLEVTAIEATSTGGTPVNLSYSYVSGNNGNIATQTNNVTSGRTQTYTYDPLNRLLTAQASATSGTDCWGQGFGNNATPPTLGDDALSNLLVISATKCSSPALSTSVNSYNQISSPTGYSYDADGDMTADNSFTYTYDAENRIRSADVSGTYYCYIYDGNGMRVEKATASSSACSSATAYELYWRNIAGNTIAETDGSGSTSNSSYNEYVFFEGRRIAQSNPSTSTVNYYFVDQLGSTRVVTTATGSARWEADYYPYGQEKTPTSFSDTCSTHYKFTGYERDPETDPGNGTGNDYAFVRYYSPRLGRFMSADPWGGDVTDPQTLNKYAYTRNNPINFVDPSGMIINYITACPQGAICVTTVESSGSGGSGGSGDGEFTDAWGDGDGGTAIAINGCSMDSMGGGSGCSPQFIILAPPPPIRTPAQQGKPGGTGGTPPQTQAQNNACTQPILNAVNNQFGTNFTPDNIQGDPFPNGGATNLNILGTGLPAAQFNSIQTGRYPLNWWSYAIGYGPTLHITGQGLFDPAPAGFTNSNVGGVTSVSFTAHIDTSFAYNPIGALIHLFTDLLHLGGPRNPCP